MERQAERSQHKFNRKSRSMEIKEMAYGIKTILEAIITEYQNYRETRFKIKEHTGC